MEDLKQLQMEDWDEDQVRTWLCHIRVKEEHVQTLYEEQVTGAVLQVMSKQDLKDLHVKQGQIQLIVNKRNELLNSQNLQLAKCSTSEVRDCKKTSPMQGSPDGTPSQTSQTKPLPNKEELKSQGQVTALTSDPASSSTDSHLDSTLEKVNENSPQTPCKPRPFDKEDINFKYVRNNVLPPETGVINLICPCHEYKSLAIAVTLNRRRLQAKFANEVIRFASGCMNVRSNGTIHFGVENGNDHSGYTHGEIIGIPVKDPSIYVDALDYIEKCFKLYAEDARHCIRPPKFVEVISKNGSEGKFVIEIDVNPSIKIVRNKIYRVCLPNFNEKKNKVEYEKKTIYRRKGAKTETIDEESQDEFVSGMQERDKQREIAETTEEPSKIHEDLGRKLSILLTGGKKYLDNSQRYVLVINKCKPEDLQKLNFLLHMNVFCVFDFDPDSKTNGFFEHYLNHHPANVHFLQDYKCEDRESVSDLKKRLCLFDQTSWIFCNGCNHYDGDERPCDVNTWVISKKKHLKRTASLICNEILPNGSFVVLFLLLSPVEQPLVDTFHEFYAEMNGRNDIICISESDDNYQKWANLAQPSCSIETIDQMSIVGMKLNHVNDTIQTMLPTLVDSARYLPVSTRGLCLLKTTDEERMFTLEILSVNQCEEYKIDVQDQTEITKIERDFYRGGKISWLNLMLAERGYCEAVIQRNAYKEVVNIIDGMLKGSSGKQLVTTVHVFHHPGSGGSTVARQVLWNFRKQLRCATVKLSCAVGKICEHAIQLLEYEENDLTQCLPVLLLLEDADEDYFDEIKHELIPAIGSKMVNIVRPLFILMNCRRSNNAEKLCKNIPLEAVAVTHKLTEEEKTLFSNKRKKLEEHFEPEFILTFVLMSEEFSEEYIQDFVKHLLEGIDHSSPVTRLIKYVALLNHYVENSNISLSHCEAFLNLGIQIDHIRLKNFETSLNDQARFLFIHFRDCTSEIKSIRIVHPLVAKEILNQISDQPRSQIAMDFLKEKAFFENRFARDEFIKFVRDLFIRRHKRSKGDSVDTVFSPLIEDICNEQQAPEKAVEILTAAYECFGKDPFFAQQLARLHYKDLNFTDAIKWAEDAKYHLPTNSYILDTEGQVYRKKLNVLFDLTHLRTEVVTPDKLSEAISIAVKAIECFRAAQKAAQSEPDSMNNSGFFGEVEVGCHLLQLLSLLDIFEKDKDGSYTKLTEYLLGKDVPEVIKEPWKNFHGKLKGLQKGINEALEWISEDSSYFQTDKCEDDEGGTSNTEDHAHNPRKWLIKKTKIYARYFSFTQQEEQNLKQSTNSHLSPLVRRLQISRNGGGNITSIFSMLSDQKVNRVAEKLEKIISMYPEDHQKEKLDLVDLVNFTLSHIALACVAPRSSKLLTFSQLRELSQQFPKYKYNKSSACFLLTLLYWPDEAYDQEPNETKCQIFDTALDTMRKLYNIKMKNLPSRKKQIYTHFFLGNGHGFDKIVHKSLLEKLIPSGLNERRWKWLTGDVWKNPKVTQKLKRVKGWTENGTIFVRGHCKHHKIRILPLHFPSMPHGNENITFYLGFTYGGLFAYDIQGER
ncbi:sterile alpha motif domain-containing protein 9-like isoform X1 [Rhincodon typus]|uniref:sterile alpha motif domain-containing protein 9-like isoform X1 n=1 Tax=Rhincodon typus TaxID=259920 RepID=UPI002030FE4B|nr:sterile alpha motif domain-containing protein 9-like isoform X1 [Rhincodon typus]XP_020384780.2 sterile alpha motif domain-containing protein 9-like isoform X1 [Rhincodon typus]XP_048466750.1 sterile alpha motif domain-containing protein 9-like isoform X1 [Rhincodon typus]XP_048466751.1 sterile alpha motif domain-containing protein 9-like isoform X1 [Rhincodon typus]